MIEETVLNYLTSGLSVPVYMELPDDIKGDFVVMEKTGSGRNDRIDNSTFAIQSYSDSLYGAAQLNASVKKLMDEIDTLDSVCGVSLNSDYNYTDTTLKKYRYQAVYDIIHY